MSDRSTIRERRHRPFIGDDSPANIFNVSDGVNRQRAAYTPVLDENHKRREPRADPRAVALDELRRLCVLLDRSHDRRIAALEHYEIIR